MPAPFWVTASLAITLLLIAAWMVVWSRRDTILRPVAVIGAIAAIPLLVLAAADELGFHRPVNMVIRFDGEVTVLAHKAIPNKAVYLYLDVPGQEEPRAVVLPWNDNTAKQLQDLEDAARSDKKGRAKMRFSSSLERREPPQFYPMPQEALPPKQVQQPPAFDFEGNGQ